MVRFGAAAYPERALVWGAGCPERGAAGVGGGSRCAHRWPAGRGRGVAPAGGPGLLEFLPAPEPGRPRGEGGKKAGQREARRVRPGRPQGGQKGHPGASLAWAARPDETRVVEPGACGGCGAGVAALPGGSLLPCRFSISAGGADSDWSSDVRAAGGRAGTTAGPPPGVRDRTTAVLGRIAGAAASAGQRGVSGRGLMACGGRSGSSGAWLLIAAVRRRARRDGRAEAADVIGTTRPSPR